MTCANAEPCIDVLERVGVEECTVDATYYNDAPAKWSAFTEEIARFFSEPLPGAASALNSSGGAAKLGALGVDTQLVAGHHPPDGS